MALRLSVTSGVSGYSVGSEELLLQEKSRTDAINNAGKRLNSFIACLFFGYYVVGIKTTRTRRTRLCTRVLMDVFLYR